MNRQSRVQLYAVTDQRDRAKNTHKPKRDALASYVNKGKVYPYGSTRQGFINNNNSKGAN